MADLNFEDILAKITQNPEIIEKVSKIAHSDDGGSLSDSLPKVIEAILPQVEEAKQEANEKNTDTGPQKDDEAHSTSLSLPVGKISKKISKNSHLLMALKPYLSKERCDIVDSIVKMAQVADLLSITK